MGGDIAHQKRGTRVIEVTRAEFEEVTALLLSQTIDMMRTVISDVEAKGHRINEILLVGGSSKMPQVKRAVQAELGLEPQLRDPDLAVAKGAALAADRIAQLATDDGSEPAGGDGGPSGEGGPRGGLGSGAGLIQDVCPWSFGLLVVENGTQVIQYMVERNEPIPARVERTFSTAVDDQTALVSGIYQQQPGAPGSNDPEENVLILDFTVEGIETGFAKGTPVDIAFVMDQSGLITVEAHHPGRAEPAVVTASVALGGVSAEDSTSKLAHLAVRA
ncbi:MAG: Hsp70 family protein [Solirubrobacteraceae bacterium]